MIIDITGIQNGLPIRVKLSKLTGPYLAQAAQEAKVPLGVYISRLLDAIAHDDRQSEPEGQFTSLEDEREAFYRNRDSKPPAHLHLVTDKNRPK